jgi:glycosyltransferase involved in cell wall biosynthesis
VKKTSSKIKVMLISAGHLPIDPRIVSKIYSSLQQDYDVCLVLPNLPFKTLFTPQIPFFKSVIARVLICQPIIFVYFLIFRPRIVHIFMAELLPLAFVFDWFGATVIYEVQENLYKKIPTKTRNNGWLIERIFRFFDQKARHHFSLIFTEKAYLNEYKILAKPHALVQNFASSTWLDYDFPTPNHVIPEFYYAGVISYERAFDTMTKAVALVSQKYPTVKLHLFGIVRITEAALQQDEDYQKAKNNILFHGHLPQKQAFRYAQRCIAGIALLKPVGDYTDSYPTKIFDYMALGLPVITANFDLYKPIVETQNCGFCTNPTDAQSVANAMIALIEDPSLTQKMGTAGRKAIAQQYNWELEAKKLKDLYQLLASS